MKKMFTKLQTHVSRIVSVIGIAVMGFSPQLVEAQIASTNPAPYCKANFTSMTAGPCTLNYGSGPGSVIIKNPAGATIFSYAETPCPPSILTDYRFFDRLNFGRAILTRENNYEFEIRIQTGGLGNNRTVGLWVDFNQNNTFDADEFFTDLSGATNGAMNRTTVFRRNLNLTCDMPAGIFRCRVMTGIHVITAAGACTGTSYGETWDFEIEVLPSPPLPIPDFVASSDIFVSTPSMIINTTTDKNFKFAWDLDLNGTVDATTLNFPVLLNTPGTRFVKLEVSGCGDAGVIKDSIIKAINVKNPTTAPRPDFFANRTRVEEFDEVMLVDVSEEGPTDWHWRLENPVDPFGNLNTQLGDGTPIGPGSRRNRILFTMQDMGFFDVTLTAYNSVGNRNKKKDAYIEVVPYSEFRLGAGATSTELGSGTIYDKFGPNANYLTGLNGDPSVNRLRIQPCGAISITLNVERFKFGLVTHNLKVWDGPNPAFGKPLHPPGGFNKENSKVPFQIVATSGAMYMELDTEAAGAVDSGMIAYFVSDFGTVGPPQPSIGLGTGLPVAYTQAITEVKSTSQNIFGLAGYLWSVNGNPVNPMNYIGDGASFNHTFTSSGTYQVCMDITTCTGDVTYCDDIEVVDPTSPTSLDFTANNTRPDAFEFITLTSKSDKANRFLWEINPPGKFNFQTPFNFTSKDISGAFTEAGLYTITLKAWSTFDSSLTSRTITKQNYVVVVDYCNPSVQIVSGDVGLRNVRINNANNQTVFIKSTTTGLTGYENFTATNDERIPLLVGGTYTITLSRESNSDAASHAVFIDYNGDGIFSPEERVLHVLNTSNITTTGSFKIPDVENIFNDFPVRMRVVSSLKTDEPTACGPLQVGEYEDYLVNIMSITDAPVITLLGSDTMRIEENQGYNEPGFVATDILEGDISSRVIIDSDLVESSAGIYYLTYSVRNASNISATSVTRVVIVSVDNTPPVLTILGSNPDTVDVFTDYVDMGVSAIDAVDGDISSFVDVSSNLNVDILGSYEIVYTARDQIGNTSVATRTVVVVDRVAPVISAIGSNNIELGLFWFDQTNISDNYWPSNQVTVTKEYGFSGPVRWDVKGTYTVKYIAVDGSGNRSELIRVYNVGDFTPPTVLLNTSDTIYHDVNTNYTPITPSVSDNNPLSPVQVSLTSTVNPNVIGLYTDTYRAIDGSSNVTNKIRYVYVVDREAPVINAPFICSRVGIEFNSTSTITIRDNYYSSEELVDLVEVVNSNVNAYLVGNYTVEYQVTDPSGNISIPATQQVQISENCELVTGLDKIDISSLVKVYPNPSSGLFNVDITKLAGATNVVRVMDNIGNEVLRLDASMVSNGNFVVDLSSLSAGVYMLNIEGVEHNVVVRLVLVK